MGQCLIKNGQCSIEFRTLATRYLPTIKGTTQRCKWNLSCTVMWQE